MTVNRVCGSGAQATVSAAQNILMGSVDTAIAGGMENMDAAPYPIQRGRWGTAPESYHDRRQRCTNLCSDHIHNRSSRPISAADEIPNESAFSAHAKRLESVEHPDHTGANAITLARHIVSQVAARSKRQPILLKKPKIERARKSRESRFLAVPTAAKPCRADTKVRSRLCVKR